MSRRLKLHSILCGILSCPERGKECRAYFQPPASVSMKYPAIVYALKISDAVGNFNGGNSFENTFNITGSNPKEIAEEVSNIIQRQVERRDASWA